MAARIRPMSNSVEGAVGMLAGATAELHPPFELEDKELSIFKEIVGQRETATWNLYDLRVAANLARLERRFNELNEHIDIEGYTTRNDRGTMVANPKVAMMKDTRVTCGMLARQLGISAAQLGLASQDQSRRNAADSKARNVIAKAKEYDDLI